MPTPAEILRRWARDGRMAGGLVLCQVAEDHADLLADLRRLRQLHEADCDFVSSTAHECNCGAKAANDIIDRHEARARELTGGSDANAK